jgi:hypothetical protein
MQRYAAVALLLLALCVGEGRGQSCAFPEGLAVASCPALAAAVAAREPCVQVTASMQCLEEMALSSETVMHIYGHDGTGAAVEITALGQRLFSISNATLTLRTLSLLRTSGMLVSGGVLSVTRGHLTLESCSVRGVSARDGRDFLSASLPLIV